MDFRLLDILGLQTTRHPGTSDHQPSMDSRLLGIRGLQTTRHPGTSDYQPSGDFRLPAFYGLQATRHPGTSDYQPSGDFRLPALYGLQATNHPSVGSRLPIILLRTVGYQSSFFGDFRYFVECLCLSCSSFILSIFLPHLWLSLAQLSPSLFVLHLDCLF